MSSNAPFSYKEVEAILERLGYWQSNSDGRHRIFSKEGMPDVTVPDHKEISVGMLATIIKKIGMTKKDFLKLRGK